MLKKTMSKMNYYTKSLRKVENVLKHCCRQRLQVTQLIPKQKETETSLKMILWDFSLVFLGRFRSFEGLFLLWNHEICHVIAFRQLAEVDFCGKSLLQRSVMVGLFCKMEAGYFRSSFVYLL
jgi:hypothetical protein